MKRNFITRFIGLGLLAIVSTSFLSCSYDMVSEDNIGKQTPNKRTDIDLDPETRAAANELKSFYVNFTTDAIKTMDNEGKETNIVVSPLSCAMMLGMLANGLDTSQCDPVMEYLGISDLDAMNSLCLTLLNSLPCADNQTKMNLVNSIWVDSHYKLNSDYTSVMDNFYKAVYDYDDFKTNQNAIIDKINDWCSKNTEGLIDKIIDEIDSNNIAFLLNALYFKGSWNGSPFDKNKTETDTFYGMSGKSKVKMMNAPDVEATYGSDSDMEAFSLNFGNGTFTFTVVMPNEGISPQEWLPMITPERISSLGKKMYPSTLKLKLPKFKIDGNKLNLKKIFSDAGLTVFDHDIDLKMFTTTEKVWLDIDQKTVFNVDEDGAEGAAVTMAGIVLTGLGPNPTPIKVNVNRPFLFFINETSTGTCLMSGRIADL